MRIIHIPVTIVILCIPFIICKEDNVNSANVENLKILRNSVNFAYKAGNNFLDLIRGNTSLDQPMEHAVKTFANKRDYKLSDLFPIYLPYVGFICLTLIGFLFVVLVPIVGFCFCCCRCCGKCGGKIKGMDPKHATCKRYTYAIFLGMISIVQLAGIVLAFINNQLIHDTLTNQSEEISAIHQLSRGTETLKVSLKNISEAIDACDKMSLGKLPVIIDGTKFEDSYCDWYINALKVEVNNLNININLEKISDQLKIIVENTKGVRPSNENLQKYALELQSESRKLKIDKIRSQICSMHPDTIKNDFKDLRDIMRNQIKTGSTSEKLKDIVTVINSTIVRSLNTFLTLFRQHAKNDYMEYRMYISIGVCCLLLLIVLFYFLGLCFGQCGERPFEDARICNRGVGANLMMAGVAFAFLFTPSIMVLEILLFLSGGPTQTELCRYVSNIDQPMVGSLDKALQIISRKENKYVNNNILNSIFNKCSTDAMTDAFNVDNDLMSPDIVSKIEEIISKVKNVPVESKYGVVNGYFQSVEALLNNIGKEIENSGKSFGGFDDATRYKIMNQLDSVRTLIRMFDLAVIKEKFKNCFENVANTGFNETLRSETKAVLSKVYLDSYSSVKCDGIYRSMRSISDSFCITFLWPFNGFWYGVGICLIFTIPAIIFAVKLAGLYRRTEKYSADYEEPDYHSYMGFYTNNADNIPMKRPKSAKSNSKNRNSNSNNKDSLKQNNPQYLPVYPYDAYE